MTERTASPIFFGENLFLVKGSSSLAKWFLRLWPRHAKQIRHIAFAEWTPFPARPNWRERSRTDMFARMGSLPRLESLVITIDEWEMLLRMIEESNTPFTWHASLSAGPQMYMHMVRAEDMSGLESLRNLRHVDFVMPRQSSSRRSCVTQGSIPGGFLETVIRRQIMQSGHTKS